MNSQSANFPAPLDASHSWRRRTSLFLMLISGFAGLGYQIVWTQQSALWLGHESAGVLAVVTAFFGGLAVGAFTLGPRIESSARPTLWYVGCELTIAVWGLLLVFAMAPSSAWLLAITGVQPTPVWQWTAAFVGTFLLLLPATAAMGATLPAMERIGARMRMQGRSIATLYASNTLGAVFGVLAIAFWFAPQFGFARTAGICVLLNLTCALTAIVALPRTAEPMHRLASDSHGRRDVLVRLVATGFLGIGYEVLVVRVLSQVAEDTVYTFAMLLAVYLVGTSVGAAGYQRRWAKLSDRGEPGERADRLGDRLLCALAAACLIGTMSLWAAERAKTMALAGLGASMTAALAAEAFMALLAFSLPTIAMGALFSHLNRRANACGVSFGHALGVNTLGAAAAPLAFGVVLFPALGAKLALLLVTFGYLSLTGWRTWRSRVFVLPASIALALALLAPKLAFVDVPAGGRILSYREGVMASVSVVEDAEGVALLRIDNRQQEGSSATRRVDGRQALLPVFLHPAPARVLFLGLGTGVTASSAAEDSTLQVDAVELLPEVIAASAHFTRPILENAPNARFNLIAADARRYVRTNKHGYDVIVADNFHPARSGSGSLYTVEHFIAVRAQLNAGGLFCQWLPLHQLDLDTLRSVVQSFLRVFPNGVAMLASNSLDTPVVGLVGRNDLRRYDIETMRQRLANGAQSERLVGVGIEDEFALLGGFIAGPKALRRFAGITAANTDDHPVVAYRAPRITYAPDSLPRDRLIALLAEFSIEPAELLDASPQENLSQRLSNYWMARNRFIESGRNVRVAREVRDMLSQVRDPLLSVLRISPDFRPAYDPLLRMATALSQIDMTEARELMTELAQIQPARPEAALALGQLGAAR